MAKGKPRRKSKPAKAKRPARKPMRRTARTAKPTQPRRAKPALASPARKPRASPAPAGVTVKRPAVHAPASLAARDSEFEVKLDASPEVVATSPMAKAALEATKSRGGALTYAQTGVDIQKEDKAIEALAGMVNFSRIGFGAPMGKIGHFAGLIDFGSDHALVLCTDGVGSKVEVANALRKWDTVGIDCMAMNVNDALCVGAEPLAFVDYLAVQDPDPELTRQVGAGLNEGARQSNCSLIGGETASLPGIIKGFDLAGTCLAYVRKDAIVDGSRIRPGDVLIGLASTGIHSNGYSLARKAFERGGHKYTDPWPWADDAEYKGKRIGDVLLEPTRIYVKEILALLKSGIPVHGLSHITGSGLRKIRRIKQDVAYHVTKPLPVQPVFRRVQELGAIANAEMYKTFNMGMGFVVVVPAEAARKALNLLRSLVPYEVKLVGEVRPGSGVHHPKGGVH